MYEHINYQQNILLIKSKKTSIQFDLNKKADSKETASTNQINRIIRN